MGAGGSVVSGAAAVTGPGGCSQPRKLGPFTVEMCWIWPLSRARLSPRASAWRSVSMPISPGVSRDGSTGSFTAVPGGGMLIPSWRKASAMGVPPAAALMAAAS